MDGRITCLPVVRRVPGANADPAAVPAAVPLDQHQLPVTLDRAAAARMLPLPASCGLQNLNHIKASESTHNAFKFGTALQKPALTYCLNMQNMPENMQESTQDSEMTKNMQNIIKKYAEYDKKLEYAEQYAKYDKKYVQICSMC